MADIDTMIAQLAAQPAPVRTARPWRLLVQWFLAADIYVAAILCFAGLRPDLRAALNHPLFAAEIALLLLLAVSAMVSALLYSYPDLLQRKSLARAPFAVFALFILVMGIALYDEPPRMPMPAHEMICTLCIALYALLPGALMFRAMRAQATTHAATAGAIAALAAFSLGALILRLEEPTDSVTHVVLMHYLPMLAACGIGMWLGRKLFKW